MLCDPHISASRAGTPHYLPTASQGGSGRSNISQLDSAAWRLPPHFRVNVNQRPADEYQVVDVCTSLCDLCTGQLRCDAEVQPSAYPNTREPPMGVKTGNHTSHSFHAMRSIISSSSSSLACTSSPPWKCSTSSSSSSKVRLGPATLLGPSLCAITFLTPLGFSLRSSNAH